MLIIERTKWIFGNLGYHAPTKVTEVKDIYEARKYVKDELELLKNGDNKWREEDQNFDPKSIYLTNGHNIIWYEFLKE